MTSSVDENPAQPADSTAFVEMASELFGENAEITESESGDYVLAFKITPSTQYNPNDRVSFAIIDAATKKVTHQRENYTGTVHWFDDYRLELMPAIGIVRAEGNSSADKFRLLLNAKTRLMEEVQVAK